MPDEQNTRLAILDELDKFNTAPEAPSLMLSILQEEEANQRQQEQRETQTQRPATTETTEEEGEQQPDHYLPLNTSIQELRNELVNLRRENQNLWQQQHQQQNYRTQQQQEQQPQYDPDAPVTAHQMYTLAQRQEMTHKMGVEAYRHNIATRGHLELWRFQQKHPDFNFDPREIDAAVTQATREGTLDRLAAANWYGVFEQYYAPQRQQQHESLRKENEKLKAELETLKKRSATAAPQQPISPATGRNTRAASGVQTPLQSSNDDNIVKLKSFSQKGNFRGFAKDLKAMMR